MPAGSRSRAPAIHDRLESVESAGSARVRGSAAGTGILASSGHGFGCSRRGCSSSELWKTCGNSFWNESVSVRKSRRGHSLATPAGSSEATRAALRFCPPGGRPQEQETDPSVRRRPGTIVQARPSFADAGRLFPRAAASFFPQPPAVLPAGGGRPSPGRGSSHWPSMTVFSEPGHGTDTRETLRVTRASRMSTHCLSRANERV